MIVIEGVVIYVIHMVIISLVGVVAVYLQSVVSSANLGNCWLHWQGVD